ncbi:hypothetical protein [Rhizobium sp. L43]|nr:hypothetical protein [Rhizobium sp. L43]
MPAGQSALGLVGEPEEFGGVTTNLLSEESHRINAQTIAAAGGYII